MNVEAKEKNNQKFIECIPGEILIRNERDVLDLVGLCGENDSNRVLLHESNLSEDFFDLKTGLAGAMFQKFSNYAMKAVAVVNFKNIKSERFKELMSESNKGNQFHFYSDRDTAEKWLVA